MEKEQTLRILNALANGVHPATGEKFAADSPYQHPDTVRALFEAMRAVDDYTPDALVDLGPEVSSAIREMDARMSDLENALGDVSNVFVKLRKAVK